ncbi:DUF2584 family protein [Oscillatoriales cyanobacterium LEGE 11467]|uniref:DUF2584 family protein n=1 Tax=Zarconia navalis LEGE 11467 TaxID=1828826 RepID=A0A928Z9H3_9CYAN|nr:DUF2584 domain-containing protein [Zarconia navalis]MBE9042670.1 DUF2584 family protein [Zarconia navalis LEGE 11467]
MGMPCEVNSILKLKPSQGYPTQLEKGQRYQAQKEGYRIIPVDVPIPLVDENWLARVDIKICRLVWENGVTNLEFEIDRIYRVPMLTKEF